MREILFRGFWENENGTKTIVLKGKEIKGEWVQGFYLVDDSPMWLGESAAHCICKVEYSSIGFIARTKVIPETVGQYTGFTVPSGKIFEHDIVTAKFKSNGARYNFTVKYSKADGCYVFDNGSVKVPFRAIRSVRIIGNIHDNPELLKG